MNSDELKRQIVSAGRRAVEQLIKVAKENIIKPDIEDEMAADRLKHAAAPNKLAIFDAIEILNKIDVEEENLKDVNVKVSNQGFAERKSK